MSKKFTYEEVKRYVEENSNCKLLSTEYKNNSTKLLFKCGCEDKNKFETTFSEFKHHNKNQCNECGKSILAKTKANTWEYVRDYVKNNSDCILLSETYTHSNDKLTFKCKCGKEFKATFSNFKSKNKRLCNNCSSNNIPLKYEDVKNYIDSTGNKLLSTVYIDNSTKLKIECRECGDIYYRNFNVFKTSKHKVCKNCSNKITREKQSLTYEEIKSYIEDVSDCKLISKTYKNTKSKLELLCGKCGKNTFKTSFVNFKYATKTYCNNCSVRSKSELIIENYLKVRNIEFIPQYSTEKCKYKKPLYFDFFIPLCNIIIEANGIQHYSPTNFGGISDEKANDRFKEQQLRDKTKINFCEKNNIKLLQIPYTEFNNIEEILNELLL